MSLPMEEATELCKNLMEAGLLRLHAPNSLYKLPYKNMIVASLSDDFWADMTHYHVINNICHSVDHGSILRKEMGETCPTVGQIIDRQRRGFLPFYMPSSGILSFSEIKKLQPKDEEVVDDPIDEVEEAPGREKGYWYWLVVGGGKAHIPKSNIDGAASLEELLLAKSVSKLWMPSVWTPVFDVYEPRATFVRNSLKSSDNAVGVTIGPNEKLGVVFNETPSKNLYWPCERISS